MRNQIGGRVQLTDSERKELVELGAQLGKKALSEIATVAQPDAILAWKRKFADQPANTVEPSKSVGRPRVDKEIEDWEQTGTEVVFAEAQPLRSSDMSQVLVLSSARRRRPIRDGPVQPQQWLDRVLIDD